MTVPVGSVSTSRTTRSGRSRRSAVVTLKTSPVHSWVCRSRAASGTFRGSMSSMTMTLVGLV